MELNKKTIRNIFFVAVGCILLYWLLHETEQVKSIFSVIKSILSPFIMGASIAFVLNVPMRAFERLLKKIQKPRLRRLTAVVLTILALLLVLALVFWLLIPQMIETFQTLIPKLQTFFQGVGNFFRDFMDDNPQLMEWVSNNTDFENMDLAGVVQEVLTMAGNSISTILSGAFSTIGTVVGKIVDFVIALVFAMYCLFQKETLARQGRKLLYAFLPERVCDRIVRILRLSNAAFSNFLSGQCVEVCILGSMFAITMAIFRMPYIPLVSVLVAVTAFIPVVGAWIGCILGAFLILVDNPIQALWFVAMFVILQQIENNVIYPRVVGNSIGLSGMWVLVAIAIGGELMGVAGMFIMIPVASVIYTLLREITNKRLAKRQIAPEKLQEQPMERQSRFKAKRTQSRQKHAAKKEARQESEKDE